MGQIILHASLDFSGFVLPAYTNSLVRPSRQHITLALQSTQASKLLDNSNKSPR